MERKEKIKGKRIHTNREKMTLKRKELIANKR